MAKDRTCLDVKGFSASTGEPTVSFGRIIVEPNPPENPPWHQQPWVRKALEVGATELVKEVIKALIKLILGRQRQPSEAGQV